MKILFFSQDENVHSLIEGVNHQNLVVSDDMDFIQEASEQARALIFIDFDGDKKAAEKLNTMLMEGDGVRIIMTETIKLNELKKHQKGKTAADGYVRKPLSLKVINEVLNDFELSDFIGASEAFNEGDKLGEVSLSRLTGGAGEFDEDSDDEDSQIDFSANVMKVDDRVKQQLDAHSLHGDNSPNFATPINVDIQNKFDMVFDRPFLPEDHASEEEDVHIPGPDEQETGPAVTSAPAGGFSLDLGDDDADEDVDLDLSEASSDDEDLDSLDLGGEDDAEIDLSEDESSDSQNENDEKIDLDLSEDDEEPESFDLSMDEEAAPPQEESMKEDNDLDLDVEEEEDLDEGALEFGGAAEESEDEVLDDEVEGLDFGISEDSEEGASLESAEDNTEEKGGFDLGSDDEEDSGLDLGSDDDSALDLGSDDDSALDLGSDDDSALDLGSDDDEDDSALDLGSDDDDSALDLGSDDEEDGGLDLGSDDSGSLDLGEPDSEDGLDLSASEEELSYEEEDDDVSATLEGIVASAPDSEEDEGELNIGGDLDEDSDLGLSAEVDLDDELDLGEEDASEVLDFSSEEESEDESELEEEGLDLSADDEQEDQGLDSFEEETNPTIVMGAEDDSLREFKAPIPGREEEEEVSFDDELEEENEDEDEDVLDLGAAEEEEDDNEVTMTEMMTSPLEAEAEAEEYEEIEEGPEEMLEQESEAATPAPPARPAPAPPVVETPMIITPEEQRVAEAFNQTEQARLQATIRQLREEREDLLKEIHELKTDGKLGEQERLGLQAELDEAKIEIQILKKRNRDELGELKYQLRLSEEKKLMYEERAKNVQREFDRLNQKVRIDINQVKQREKELESQLELVTMDSQSQVKSRDVKILDLKRKIDSLEFNMENASIRELKSREDKERVEERLEKIMRTLRGSLKSLESEDEIDDGILDKIDKL